MFLVEKNPTEFYLETMFTSSPKLAQLAVVLV
jgi:hypothetical protein